MNKLIVLIYCCIFSLVAINSSYGFAIYNHTKYTARINHMTFGMPHRYIYPHEKYSRKQHEWPPEKYNNLIITKSTRNNNYECKITDEFDFLKGSYLSIYEGRYHAWCRKDICIRSFDNNNPHNYTTESCNFHKY